MQTEIEFFDVETRLQGCHMECGIILKKAKGQGNSYKYRVMTPPHLAETISFRFVKGVAPSKEEAIKTCVTLINLWCGQDAQKGAA